jgi:hypothetical protein
MSVYKPLESFLKGTHFQEVPMTFSEISQLLGRELPSSAYRHRPWWANEATGHSHARAWLNAGYETAQVDMEGRKLVFRRIADRPQTVNAMQESRPMFQHAPQAASGGRHPIFGALKGSFTIQPGWNLESPALDEEGSLALEQGIEATAALIEQGIAAEKA